ncbi:hypothetical protein [Geitlerinema calcuttense]|uniref:Type II secretion system protein GspC N-terminal domain-containing protein n=1 Tax=Geitlerinema calcuttense NRMC-F 0142 TaxID=2922238 RepID=A0ABT7LYG7_9CYAN|nr:hypothetical protein [Geitlerinema calcuttense]MDL5057038.1 hypothetical protein [Geitlerinema calcuttense NRMC-F 0142]
MKTLEWILGGSAIALLLISCGENTATTEPAPSPVAEAVPSPAPAPTAQFPPSSELPAVRVQPNAAPAPTAPGLIQSTNPQERIAQISAGRSDPFNPIVTAAVVVPKAVNSARPIPQPAPLPGAIPPSAAGNPPNRNASTNPSPAAPLIAKVPPLPALETVPLPNLVAASSDLPALSGLVPLASESSLTSRANAVQVTGVMQYGNSFTAIVKAPDEKSDRYVVPGEFLSNGQIMVKRIEITPGGEPVVILEENGIETIRPVGTPKLAGNF